MAVTKAEVGKQYASKQDSKVRIEVDVVDTKSKSIKYHFTEHPDQNMLGKNKSCLMSQFASFVPVDAETAPQKETAKTETKTADKKPEKNVSRETSKEKKEKKPRKDSTEVAQRKQARLDKVSLIAKGLKSAKVMEHKYEVILCVGDSKKNIVEFWVKKDAGVEVFTRKNVFDLLQSAKLVKTCDVTDSFNMTHHFRLGDDVSLVDFVKAVDKIILDNSDAIVNEKKLKKEAEKAEKKAQKEAEKAAKKSADEKTADKKAPVKKDAKKQTATTK